MAGETTAKNGTAREVFLAFLPLGFTSFGGPVAHLGFFRTAFVERRGWFTDAAYADLVALCQFLPGPASSQVGMAIGLTRAGFAGMLAAWIAFTLPSAVALTLFGLLIGTTGVVEGAGWLVGLKAAAVAVVAHALLGMTRSLAATRERAAIAGLAAIIVLLAPDRGMAQLAVIALGALAGLVLPDVASPEPGGARAPVGRRVGVAALLAFALLLAGLPLLAPLGAPLDLFDRTYRAGALVFGGGHVVLPLLEGELAGMVDQATFLAGYGAAQAVPGPLFTFAAFLGTVAEPFGGVPGAVVALVGIFLPSMLLVLGVLPFWDDLRRMAVARRALAGVNAAVVGLLGAAFYDPVFTRGIPDVGALSLAIAAFAALAAWRTPAWLVVIVAGAIGGFVL
ncbi:chromate efflux transporter [Acuticoccus sp. M5D2P5]|uniref:chromate efflux transporter n=1 Tax=Acuticoccus kalidii TaxID=2910977 RepID=UPI001F46E540|nr:chromate efflux transporter [Acuticoccus kalidii]MCF3932252.1 chromate efflux transporter [Acuticoccus kalidii]